MASPTDIFNKVLGTKPAGDVTLQDFAAERENQEIIAWVKSAYSAAKSARTQIEQTWYTNMVMLDGRQYLTRVPEGQPNAGKLVRPPAPPYRVRSVTNRLRPIFRTELARVTSQKPNASIVPASSDDEDLFAAQAGEQIWESLYSTKKISQVFARTMWWTLVCGTGFTKCWWDNNSVDSMTGVQGDIKYAHVTPFHLGIPDLREPEIEDQPYVINAYTKPVEWMRQFYGEELNADSVSSNEIIEGAYLNLNMNDKPDSVLVIEAWIKPGGSRYFPQGGYVCVAGDKVLQISREGLPYQHGEYPFVKFEHIPTGKFYGASVLEDLTPLQREYNRTRSQIIEAKNRMAKPQLLAARGSVDPRKITNEPGQVIQYKPGLPPPQPLPLQPLPSYVQQELEVVKGDMEDISGQHQVSRGDAPPGVTAATAISYLQEKDDSLLSHTYSSIEIGFEKLAKQSLSHVVQFWDLERTVQTTGVDGSFDAITIKGSNIASGTDIRMEAGSSLPTSKAARQALLMDLMKFGWIPPQEGLKLMEIGGVQKLWQQIKIDEAQAQRENLKMRKLTSQEIGRWMEEKAAADLQNQFAGMPQVGAPPGMGDPLDAGEAPFDPFGQQQQQPQDPQNTNDPTVDLTSGQPLGVGPIVPVNTWDNHAVHIDVHNRFRKTQAFENLPDEIKQQFELHVSLHAQSMIAGSTGMGPDMGMAPTPQDMGMDPSQQGGDTGGAANQFGPSQEAGAGQAPLPGM